MIHQLQDTRYEIPRSIQAAKRFRQAGAVVEFNISGSPCVCMPDVWINHVPVVDVSPVSPGTDIKPPWFFTSAPTWADVTALSVLWARDYWKDKHPQEERPMRFGVIVYDRPQFHSEVLDICSDVASLLGGLEYIGGEVVPVFGLIDSTTEWLRLASKKPDFVWVVSYGGCLVTLIKDYDRLDLREKGIEYIGSVYSIDEVILGIVRKSAEGCFVSRIMPTTWETDNPRIRFMHEMAKKYRGQDPEDVSSHYVTSWVFFSVIAEGIRLALEEVGYENLTPRAVRDGLASITDLDTGLVPPITMSDEWPHIFSCARTYQVQQGKQMPVTDWYEIKFVTPELFQYFR